MAILPPADIDPVQAGTMFMPHRNTVNAIVRRIGRPSKDLYEEIGQMAIELGRNLAAVLHARGWPDDEMEKRAVVREAVVQTLVDGPVRRGELTLEKAKLLLSGAWDRSLSVVASSNQDRSVFWTEAFRGIVSRALPMLVQDGHALNSLAYWYWARDLSSVGSSDQDHLARISRKLDQGGRIHGVDTLYPEEPVFVPVESPHALVLARPRWGPPMRGTDRPVDLPRVNAWREVAVPPVVTRPSTSGEVLIAAALVLGGLAAWTGLG